MAVHFHPDLGDLSPRCALFYSFVIVYQKSSRYSEELSLSVIARPRAADSSSHLLGQGYQGSKAHQRRIPGVSADTSSTLCWTRKALSTASWLRDQDEILFEQRFSRMLLRLLISEGIVPWCRVYLRLASPDSKVSAWLSLGQHKCCSLAKQRVRPTSISMARGPKKHLKRVSAELIVTARCT